MDKTTAPKQCQKCELTWRRIVLYLEHDAPRAIVLRDVPVINVLNPTIGHEFWET